MTSISFSELLSLARGKSKKKIVIAAAEDEHVLIAVKNAFQQGFIEPIFIGDALLIKSLCEKISFDISSFELINEPNVDKSASKAVALIKEGNAEILMKGLLSTSVLLKAALTMDDGPKKNTLFSHIAFFETPYYHKLIAIADAAMNIAPNLAEKVNILNNSVAIFHRLGNTNPKVAVVCPMEMVNEKIESTVHAAMLTLMNKRGQITGCSVDGPLALDNAISHHAAEHKGIKSDVAGDADLLLLPDLNSGNVLYKSLIFLGGATCAAIITGARVPIVLTSRADSERSKLMSIALAAALI
jgi:phosphate butyryltransferase